MAQVLIRKADMLVLSTYEDSERVYLDDNIVYSPKITVNLGKKKVQLYKDVKVQIPADPNLKYFFNGKAFLKVPS